MSRYVCGDVLFMRNGAYVPLMGDERVAALRAAYQRKLGDGLVMCVRDFGLKHITWYDVLWETCGERVTGDST